MNVRDAEWWFADSRGAACNFESEYGEPQVEFAQLGINITVLEPSQSGLYHAESAQEAFLVLSGECRLLVEGEERLLRPWDFFHSPPWTAHAFVGGGRRAVRDPDGGGTRACDPVRGGAGAVPRVGARGALWRKCGAGHLRSGAGVRDGRVVPPRATLVLGSPPLGLAPPSRESTGSLSALVASDGRYSGIKARGAEGAYTRSARLEYSR